MIRTAAADLARVEQDRSLETKIRELRGVLADIATGGLKVRDRANLTDKLIGNKIRTSGTSDEKTPKPLYWSNLWLGSEYAL